MNRGTAFACFVRYGDGRAIWPDFVNEMGRPCFTVKAFLDRRDLSDGRVVRGKARPTATRERRRLNPVLQGSAAAAPHWRRAVKGAKRQFGSPMLQWLGGAGDRWRHSPGGPRVARSLPCCGIIASAPWAGIANSMTKSSHHDAVGVSGRLWS